MDSIISQLSQYQEDKRILESRLREVSQKIKKLEEDICKICYPHEWYVEKENGVYSQKYKICKICQTIKL